MVAVQGLKWQWPDGVLATVGVIEPMLENSFSHFQGYHFPFAPVHWS